MAITGVDYRIFHQLHASKLLPARPSLLELGEAEWFGDVPLDRLSEDIDRLVADEARREALHVDMASLMAEEPPTYAWDLAKIFFRAFLDPRRMVAVDLHGTDAALKLDLNEPVELGEQFDVVMNGGTGEHVFDVRRFFEMLHAHTRPGGLMIHCMPFRGWLEHGFYSFNPTFYWDLAAANGYTVLLLAHTETEPLRVVPLTRRAQIVELARAESLGANANLYAVLRKGEAETAFRVPMQGFYAGTLGDDMVRAWREER